MNKSKIKSIVVSIVCIIAAVVLVITSVVIKNKEEAEINSLKQSNNIVISSKNLQVNSGLDPFVFFTYKTRVVGKVKNITDSEIEDITIFVKIKQTFYAGTYDLTINIDRIAPNAEYEIEKEFSTDESYSTVLSVKASIDGGPQFEMIKESDLDISSFKLTACFIGSIIFAFIALIFFISIFTDKTDTNVLATVNAQNFSDGTPMVDENDAEVIALKKELEKERIKKELSEYTQPKYVKCQYCGTRNDIRKSKCTGCGSAIEK